MQLDLTNKETLRVRSIRREPAGQARIVLQAAAP
jgi:hypothetical protein